ncbi:hypothetical protein Q9189_007714 [Teloschistes chrysophthalmus]
MQLQHFFTLTSFLLLLFTSSTIAAPYNASPFPQPQESDRQISHHARYIDRRVISDGSPTKSFTMNTLTHKTTFTFLAAYVPSNAAANALVRIYHEILYQCSPKGAWFHSPPLPRIVVRIKDAYVIFASANPDVPVPWQLVKEWAEAMEHVMDLNGLIGPYVATFERLVGEKMVDFWVQMGIGTPPA